MGTIDDLFDRLWRDYSRLNPQAQAIHVLLRARGEQVTNDHIAFRTYDDPKVGLDVLARPFVNFGYEPRGEYTFTEKKLSARHYEHPDAAWPKVFISELKLASFSEAFCDLVGELVAQVGDDVLGRWDLPVVGRLWKVSYKQYEALRAENEYGAWVAAFGFRANHFTVNVGELKSFDSFEQFNAFIKDNGFSLNTSGGEFKGSPQAFLEQSSTLADEADVDFTDGTHRIPACYYEFAKRHPMPDGKLFQGFVAASADKIFESTDRR